MEANQHNVFRREAVYSPYCRTGLNQVMGCVMYFYGVDFTSIWCVLYFYGENLSTMVCNAFLWCVLFFNGVLMVFPGCDMYCKSTLCKGLHAY